MVPPFSPIWWQPWQFRLRTSRRPFSTYFSSADSCFCASGATCSLVSDRTAVTIPSASSSPTQNFGMRSSSSGFLDFPRSKTRGSMSFRCTQAGRVWGIVSSSKPKSRRSTSFDPSSVSSTPMGEVFSKPAMVWQPKQP